MSSSATTDINLPKVTVYTDGGCARNPGGPGGWAAVILHRDQVFEISGGVPSTTNNRMELLAAIRSLKALNQKCSVELFTDSQYVRQGITAWLKNWIRRGWKTLDGEPIKNQDLWIELHAEASKHEMHWKWVRGHAENKWNERCDELAGREIRSKRHAKCLVDGGFQGICINVRANSSDIDDGYDADCS